MEKSLVLHIGDPRCGSTSIREVLRYHLFDAPDVRVAVSPQMNAGPLAMAMVEPKLADQRKERFVAMADWFNRAEADLAVLSSEQFFRVDPTALKKALTEVLPQQMQGLRVIAYARPHAERFVSAFMQRSKLGFVAGPMEGFFERSQSESLLNFTPRFQKWREVFGAGFTLRPMVQGVDVVQDFLSQALQGATFAQSPPVFANPSLPVEFLAALREVQKVLKQINAAPHQRHAIAEGLSRVLTRNWPGLGTKLALDEALCGDIQTLCATDAARLDEMFFDGPIMTDALNNASAATVAAPQDLNASTYYAPDMLQDLSQLTHRLLNQFQSQTNAPSLFADHQAAQSHGKTAPQDSLPPVIDQISALLTEMSVLIAAPLSATGNPTTTQYA